MSSQRHILSYESVHKSLSFSGRGKFAHTIRFPVHSFSKHASQPAHALLRQQKMTKDGKPVLPLRIRAATSEEWNIQKCPLLHETKQLSHGCVTWYPMTLPQPKHATSRILHLQLEVV